MKYPQLFYCYDAWCGWCYGFSSVIKKIANDYAPVMESEALSGGMILPVNPVHIKATAPYISEAYKEVEKLTGVKFGQDYLWHIFNPEKSDWYPDSLKPAIALCVFKSYFPNQSISIASDLQYALHYEGRDLTDDEAYRHLIEKYKINPEDFYNKLHNPEYEQLARQEFSMVQQLQVTGFPAVFIQTGELKFYMVARGYTDEKTLRQRIDAVLNNNE